MKWIDADERKPKLDKSVILACPDFCQSGYVIGQWDGESWTVDGFGEIDNEVLAWSYYKNYYPQILK